jgi:hypothetical protein
MPRSGRRPIRAFLPRVPQKNAAQGISLEVLPVQDFASARYKNEFTE